MMIWPETVGGRGADEIGSCLLKYFQQPISSRNLPVAVFSNNCGDQNKNLKIMALWQYLIVTDKFDKIVFTFQYLAIQCFHATEIMVTLSAA